MRSTIGRTRWARSYGIVDHQLLHGRYLHRLGHGAMSLYLFLCVVSDSQGSSFYREKTIRDILRLSAGQFQSALEELTSLGLISYGRPYFWLSNLDRELLHEQQCGKNKIPEGSGRPVLPADRPKNPTDSPQSIAAILRKLADQKA